MNTDQASQALGIGQNAILDAIKRGTLNAEKVGRSWEISEDDVARYKVEHRGKQGRVSKEQAQERAHKAAQTARRNRAAGTVTTEDTTAYHALMDELADARRELRESREARQPAVVLTPAPAVAGPTITAPEEIAKWVRRAEAVALRLETVATRLEVACNV